MSLKLGSLFDGSGGFPLGGMLAGIEPVWASEIEPFPILVTRSRIPQMKHCGDINALSGYDLTPVDIITFGSPCQDMSIAGRRAGLDGERSGLFHQAIRIIKEMREATNGKYPRYIVWENVPGAFSSNDGEDFLAVLTEICSIKQDVSIPRPDQWGHAGEILGKDYSIAWRVFDAQYWGVPQRRKRIYLVADLAGQSAGTILFESDGLSGYSAESFKAWQAAACRIEEGAGEAGGYLNLCINPQGNSGVGITEDSTLALVAQDHGNHPAVLQAAAFDRYNGKVTGDVSQTLNACAGTSGDNTPIVFQPADKSFAIAKEGFQGSKKANFNFAVNEEVAPTMQTSGPSAVAQPNVQAFGVCAKTSHAMLSDNPYTGFYEASTSRTVDHNGGNPSCNQGGICVVTSENEDNECNAVYSTSKGSYHTVAYKEQTETLLASDYKDPPCVNAPSDDGPNYIVRRLTPIECARLQGFPDWWCDDLAIQEPTAEELAFWKGIWTTWSKIATPSGKAKSEKQIRSWLANPCTDSAQYKLWGNGISLPIVFFVLSGIMWANSQ